MSDDESVKTRVDIELPPDESHLVISGKGQYQTIKLPDKGELIIGRTGSADVCINDESVSRRHARLFVTFPPRIQDLGSSNGTSLNNVRLDPQEIHTIGTGDVIRVGQVVLWIETAHKKRPRTAKHKREPVVEAIVVQAPATRALFETVERIAPGKINVLILGETGVGKDVLARTVHARSPRSDKPFVGINCAALAETLIESEFFGYEKGAFTGAQQAKEGLLESGHGGTVFLDEICELPLPLQAKLLRVLEERQVLRVGSTKPRPIDARFVAATNRDIALEVSEGRFRKDLYFRLNGVTLRVPPLRERKEEIEPLAKSFIRLFRSQLGRAGEPALTPRALRVLGEHSWPGNIRELRNVMERAVLLCGGDAIDEEHLTLERPAPVALNLGSDTGAWRAQDLIPPEGAFRRAADDEDDEVTEPLTLPRGVTSLKAELGEVEKERIRRVLDECAGNQTRAAKTLGISRRSLLMKLDRYGLPRPRK